MQVPLVAAFTICVCMNGARIPQGSGDDGTMRGVGVAAQPLATSRAGRGIEVVHVGRERGPGVVRPALLVVAGIDPRHGIGVEVASRLAEAIRGDPPAGLEHADVYVVPCLNPDGLEWARSVPKRSTARKPAKPGTIDADRDGRYNEDPAQDLNGDGLILTMRVKNPAPGSGLTAEYVAEADDDRLLRKSDPGKGERPVYALLEESLDQDRDGRYGEDGFDGIDLNRNFPYHWPEFHDEAGRASVSEPESRGLADWLIAHPEIVAVLVYEPRDNLVNVPGAGKFDETGQVPATAQVLEDDRPMFERIGSAYKDITRQKEAPGGDNDGSLQGWAYGHLGLWGFSTPVWVRPDQLAEAPKAAPPPAAEPAVQTDTPIAAAKPKKPVDNDEGKWMALSDKLRAAGQPGGFVEWKEFQHPVLGRVEIGGWAPGWRGSGPGSGVSKLVDEQRRFVGDLLDRLPRIGIEEPLVERLGESAWRVRVRAVNEGQMPTRSAMGVRAARLPPTRWSIDVDRSRILSGDPVQRTATIAGNGGVFDAAWTITGAAGERVTMTLRSPECGDRAVTVQLTDHAPAGKREEQR